MRVRLIKEKTIQDFVTKHAPKQKRFSGMVKCT